MSENINDEDNAIFIEKDYEKEKQLIIDNEKKALIDNLTDISKEINKHNSIREFLLNIREKKEQIVPELTTEKNKCFISFNLKVLGIIFMILFITGIYIFIGVMNSVMTEIKTAAKIYIYNTTREDNSTFFDNYNKINLGSPEFSLYFLTSGFSSKFFNCIGIYAQTILVLVINILILIGIASFGFHINENNINETYSILQFICLILIYLLLYASIGFISMLPHDIFSSAFVQYEKWKAKKEKKLLNNKNKEEGEEEIKGKYNGYFFGFFLSILVSMALKNILNQYLIIPFSTNHLKFYGILIGCGCIPILSALLIYCCFSKILTKQTEDEEEGKNKQNKHTKSGCRLLGYMFYIEEEPNPINIKCGSIRKGCRKCYVNCYCYKCCCFKCFSCEKCCCEEKSFLELSDSKFRDKKICIIYKTTGLIASCCELVTSRIIMGYSLLMFFLQIINYGSRKSLSQYLDICEDSKKNIFNLLSLGGILFFHLITVIAGFLFAKCMNLEEGVSNYIGYGVVFLAFTASIISFIISLLSYFDYIGDNIYYLFPFSIGSIEYYLILFKKISSGILRTEFIPIDSIFSIYLLIWGFFTFILDVFNSSISGLILTQFIITCISCFLGFLLMCCLFLFKDKLNKN